MRDLSRRRGSALVMAIWVITILSLLVISFAMEAKLQSHVNVYMRERVHMDHLVENGTVLAEMIVTTCQNVADETEDEDIEELLEKDRWLREKRELKKTSHVVIGPIAVDTENPDGGTVTIEVESKGGGDGGSPKFNINRLYPGGHAHWDLLWKAILTWANVPEDDQDYFVDSWVDWHDADDSQTGEYGAETEWYEDEIEYEKGEMPIKPRNSDIPDIKELAKLRWFRDHPALLGIPDAQGRFAYDPEDDDKDPVCVSNILEVLDVYGSDKIDVRHASKAVLMCIPGIQDTSLMHFTEDDRQETSDIADAIVQYAADLESGTETEYTRKESFDEVEWDWNKLMEVTENQIKPMAQEYLAFDGAKGEGALYTITITGQSMGMTHQIKAIAMVKGEELKYIRWMEDP